jgi:4a-hydroxytetrahydrobiopterin dehydratase
MVDAKQPHLWYEACTECYGIFFDAGEFKDFKEVIAFINKVADIAEAEGHHPDLLLFGWNKLKISLSTHSIDGLSENDFILASKIDQIVL